MLGATPVAIGLAVERIIAVSQRQGKVAGPWS